MRTVVTGARGFIGSHLLSHLAAEGHEAIGLGRGPRGSGFVRISPEGPAGEVASLETQLSGADAVIHLAAQSQTTPRDPLDHYLDANVRLTEAVAVAADHAGLTRFVLASSRMVYPSTLAEPATEDCHLPPDTTYGLSKKMAEQVQALYSGRSSWSGVALRIAQVFGPGDGGRGALARFIEQARRGEDIEVLGQGEAVRDVIHVDDVVSALRLAAERAVEDEVLNVGSDRGYSIRELAEMAAAAAPDGNVHVRSRATADEDRSYYRMDCTLARRTLGWRPRRDLAEVVHEVIRK